MSGIQTELFALADRAFGSADGHANNGKYIAITDIAVTEAVANGLEGPPASCAVRRPDGRACYFYRIPGTAT